MVGNIIFKWDPQSFINFIKVTKRSINKWKFAIKSCAKKSYERIKMPVE